MFLFLYLIFVLLASILGYFYVGEGMNLWYMSLCAFAMCGASILFCVTMRHEQKAWGFFSASSLFSLGFWIVHFFYASLLVVYEDIQHERGLWLFPDLGNYSMLVAVIAFSLFYVGYLSLGKTQPRMVMRSITVPSQRSLSKMLLFTPLLSMVNFAMFIAVVGPTYLSGAYAGSANWDTGATYYFQFFELFYYLTLILEVYKIRLIKRHLNVFQYVLSFNWLTLGFLVVFTLFNLYIGDRGPVIAAICILVGGYDLFIKRFNFILVVCALVVGIMSMSYISNYRTRDAGASFEERVEDAKYKLAEKHWYHAPGELGSNVRTLAAGIAFAESEGHWKGKFQGVHILGMVPFAKRVVLYVFRIPFGLTSSGYLTIMINGGRGVGVGTTPVADVYLDFGIFGVIVMFPVLGRFMAWLELNVFSSESVYIFVVYLWLQSNALYWPRAVFLHNINEIVWALFILWLVQKSLLRSHEKKEMVLARPFLG